MDIDSQFHWEDLEVPIPVSIWDLFLEYTSQFAVRDDFIGIAETVLNDVQKRVTFVMCRFPNNAKIVVHASFDRKKLFQRFNIKMN